MRHFLFKLFGSVRLVQEVTRSNGNSSSLTDAEMSSNLEQVKNDKTVPMVQKQTIEIPLVYCYKPSNLKHQFTVRHYKPISTVNNEEKSKSQKLLCLWPLPTVTRYMILIATLMSVLNWLGILSISCSAPSYILHRLDFKNLLLSPFLFDWTLQGMMLYGWNLLILGLFEESLTLMLGGGTRRFIHCLLFVSVSLSIIRVLLGFIFSKSTGWAFPSLFFSNSMHECSQGKI